MSEYKQGDLITKINRRTGFYDTESFRLITDFKNERKYGEFLSKMYLNKFNLFMEYAMGTLRFIQTSDCTLSEIDKARTSAVVNTLIAMFTIRDKNTKSEEQLEHDQYQESLFSFLDSQRKNQDKH